MSLYLVGASFKNLAILSPALPFSKSGFCSCGLPAVAATFRVGGVTGGKTRALVARESSVAALSVGGSSFFGLLGWLLDFPGPREGLDALEDSAVPDTGVADLSMALPGSCSGFAVFAVALGLALVAGALGLDFGAGRSSAASLLFLLAVNVAISSDTSVLSSEYANSPFCKCSGIPLKLARAPAKAPRTAPRCTFSPPAFAEASNVSFKELLEYLCMKCSSAGKEPSM
jgi:hypothetical protein